MFGLHTFRIEQPFLNRTALQPNGHAIPFGISYRPRLDARNAVNRRHSNKTEHKEFPFGLIPQISVRILNGRKFGFWLTVIWNLDVQISALHCIWIPIVFFSADSQQLVKPVPCNQS